MQNNPGTKNSEIAGEFPDYPENSVKTYRTQWRLKFKKLLPRKPKPGIEIKIPDETNPKDALDIIEALMKNREYTKIDVEAIEKALLELLNSGVVTPQVVKNMIDFYLKIGSKKEVLEEDIDMEVLKQIGIEITDSK